MSLREYKKFIDEILPGIRHVSVFEKQNNISCITIMTLNRLQKMFKYKGLPKTIPAEYLEMYLQNNGNCIIADVDGALYALVGSLGGDPDAYYLPRNYVVANPYLKLSKTYVRDEDCAFFRNDPYMLGVYPIIHKYAEQIAETELSMSISVINARIMSLITASTDRERQAANQFINDIIDGKLSAIGNDQFFEGIKVQPYANSAQSNAITDLIEMKQYLRAGLFNDIGLNANYNMKRESINSNESQLNDDMLAPFVDLMLEERKKGVEKVNNLFGTDIEVEFDSAWKENQIEHAAELLQLIEDVSDGGDQEAAEETPEETPEEAAEETPEEAAEEMPEETPEKDTVEEIKEEITEELQELVKEEVTENEDGTDPTENEV